MTFARTQARISVDAGANAAPRATAEPVRGPHRGSDGAFFLDAAPALTLGGPLLACNFGLLTNAAAWALIAAAAIKIAVHSIGIRFAGGGGKKTIPDVAYGLAAALMAAALGFVSLSAFLAATPASIRTAAVISTVGYVVLAAEREASRPRIALLQAVCALGLFAVGLALTWDNYATIALASTLSVAFALFMATRRLSHGVARTGEAERRFTAALNSMTHCVGMFDSSSRLIAGNSQFHRMFRLSEFAAAEAPADELLRKKLGLRLKDSLQVEALCEAVQSVAKGRTREGVTVELADARFMDFVFQSTPEGFSLLIEDVTERRASDLHIERMARIDDLTGLSNRTSFREALQRATARLGAGSPPFAVMMIDLDRFKHVNDSLGHPVGDKLLQRVAKRLQEMAEAGDMVARLGGDEFVFLRFSEREDVGAFAARAVETLSEPYHVSGAKLMIGASIGIAMAPDDSDDANELLKSADMALYAAKDAGRGSYRFFSTSMAENARRKQEIEHDLRIGIGRNELEVHYQPIISLTRRRISGCEALVRWRHPVHGLVSPGQFMPIAEESGLVVSLGEWVLRQACVDAKGWPRDVRLAVNFSAVQFARSNVADTVRRVLKETKFPASRLEMEITESVLMHDADAVLSTIDELRELGMTVALDDFGAGYSSLAYLSRFRPNKVKIDQCFVRDMAKNGTALAIIKAVKAIVQELEIEMLVEGVETVQQFEILLAHGADEAQGYLFSKPRPAREIARFVADPAQLVRGRKLITEKSAPWVKICERVNPAVARSVN